MDGYLVGSRNVLVQAQAQVIKRAGLVRVILLPVQISQLAVKLDIARVLGDGFLQCRQCQRRLVVILVGRSQGHIRPTLGWRGRNRPLIQRY